eukprot:3122344-Amphidinium_carterae.1
MRSWLRMQEVGHMLSLEFQHTTLFKSTIYFSRLSLVSLVACTGQKEVVQICNWTGKPTIPDLQLHVSDLHA